jgi:hypothetical protein
VTRFAKARIVVVTTLLVGLLLESGCGSGSNADSRRLQSSRLRDVISLYIYAGRALGRPPRDETEFKEFINNQGGKVLEKVGVSSADEMLVSERDGKPFVVLYKKPTSDKAAGIVAYEAEGVDGVRDVGYELGNISEMNEDQFAELGL